MTLLTLDFETYYAKGYSLKETAWTTEAYVRDPQFEALGVGLKTHDFMPQYIEAPFIRDALDTVKWSETTVLCHHAHFDGLILSHHYGIKPAGWLDTLPMARLVLGNATPASLDWLAKRFGLEPKSVPYDLFKGKHFSDLDDDTRAALAKGCLHDLDLTERLAKRFLTEIPQDELQYMDMTIRMFTEPELTLDGAHFEWLRDREWLCKNELMMELGVSDKVLGSNDQFTALLEAEGIEVETKPGKNGPIPAFAKTDDFMQECLNDPNPRVAKLATARLAVRSTINETRAGRLAGMASRGALTVYLNSYGAQTTRWSGGDNINLQNLGRDGLLRRGICAPLGYCLSVIDKSQIECRLLNTFCGQWDVVERFKRGEDPYLPLASRIYGEEISAADAPRRGTGKQGELMCGYGAGWRKFQATARAGSYGPKVDLSDELSQHAVRVYRDDHSKVLMGWREGDMMLRLLHDGDQTVWNDVVEIKHKRIYLPNGSFMVYDLWWDDDRRSWMRKVRNGARPIWGAIVIQNVMEALARLDLAQGFQRIYEGTEYRPKCSVHDAGWWLFPADQAQELHDYACYELSRSPAWMPQLPVAVKGHLSEVYDS